MTPSPETARKGLGRRGASGLTYGILVGLVAVVAIGAIVNIGGGVNRLFGTVAGQISGIRVPAAGVTGPGPYAFTSHTFTNCGSTGPTPPTQAQCRTAYASAPWAQQDVFFTVSSGIQAWTVPRTGTYAVDLYGAAGGRSRSETSPGLGGRIRGQISLTQGEIVHVVVGQAGEGTDGGGSGSFYYTTGGFNGGGGTGFPLNNCGNCSHASGGGASDIRRGGSGLANRIVVAGGGGGGSTETGGSDPRSGGSGGGETGGDGGGSDVGNNSGGGGGSSYPPASAGFTHNQGVRAGNGEVTITFVN